MTSNNYLFENYKDIIPDFQNFQDALHEPFPVHLRVNRIKIEPYDLVSRLSEKGIRLKEMVCPDNTMFEAPGLRSPGNLLEYYAGYIHSQAYTSCLASNALSPKPGSYILDMCASPGGKTAHLAQLIDQRGLIVANELYPSRYAALSHTLSRLGVNSCILTGYQAQEFPLKHQFDYILADVPCSGEGRLRLIREELAYKKGSNHVSSKLLAVQKKIIIRGYDLLKPGGVMLYSTCTYSPEENEEAVQFLLENRDAEILNIDLELDYEPGITCWGDKIYEQQLNRTARFYPHKFNSVGFFMARIGKRR